MMRKLDGWLVDRIDAITMRLQKRGISLVAIHCYVVAACVLIWLVETRGHPYFFAVIAMVGGACLHFTLSWAITNSEYQNNIRMTNRLNAEALGYREEQFFTRMMWLAFLPISLKHFTLPGLLLDTATWIAPTLVYYLNTSTFAGYTPSRKQHASLAPEGAH